MSDYRGVLGRISTERNTWVINGPSVLCFVTDRMYLLYTIVLDNAYVYSHNTVILNYEGMRFFQTKTA